MFESQRAQIVKDRYVYFKQFFDNFYSVVSAIAPYRDAAASQVAEQLDAEVLGLLRQVTGVPASSAP